MRAASFTQPETTAPGVVVAALKWADLFFDVDPLTGEANADPKAKGFSAADEAALELALSLGTSFGRAVVAVTVGGDDAVAGLERALAVGVDRAVLVSLEEPDPDSLNVAAALAWGLESAGLINPVVVCGDYSADRGSGVVPAGLAALSGLPQALGVVSASFADAAGHRGAAEGVPSPGRVRVQRRLDGARREELLVSPPAVISVEGAVARLRRAPLRGKLGADQGGVERLAVPADLVTGRPSAGVGEVGPPTPRTKVMPAPSGGAALTRVEQLTGMSSTSSSPSQALVVSPEEAARHLLTAWVDSGGTVPEGYDPTVDPLGEDTVDERPVAVDPFSGDPERARSTPEDPASRLDG